MIFLCGKGDGAAGILRFNVEEGQETCVFSPDDALTGLAKRLGVSFSAQSVNQMHLWTCEPDLIVSCGYLDIITPAVLERVGGKAINCHYALLPNHRGRSSVPWAILDGDSVSGVTWHWIDEGIDTGEILLQGTCQIDAKETQGSLFDKLDWLAAQYWPGAGALAATGYPGSGIPHRGRTQYHKAGPPHGGVIDPAWTDEYVERFIRAMTHPPRPYATFEGVEVKTFADYWQLKHERHHLQPV